MRIDTLHCCAVRQIDGLEFYRKDSKAALLEVCKMEYGRNNPGLPYSKTYTFYLFNGIVAYKKGSWESRNPSMVANLGYVEAFKELIEKNDLGEVVACKPEYNRVNNPSHLILNCMWKPRPIKLRNWYVKNKVA